MKLLTQLTLVKLQLLVQAPDVVEARASAKIDVKRAQGVTIFCASTAGREFHLAKKLQALT